MHQHGQPFQGDKRKGNYHDTKSGFERCLTNIHSIIRIEY